MPASAFIWAVSRAHSSGGNRPRKTVKPFSPQRFGMAEGLNLARWLGGGSRWCGLLRWSRRGGPDAAQGFAAAFGGRSAVALLAKVAPAWTACRALRAAGWTRDLARDFLDEAWFTGVILPRSEPI